MGMLSVVPRRIFATFVHLKPMWCLFDLAGYIALWFRMVGVGRFGSTKQTFASFSKLSQSLLTVGSVECNHSCSSDWLFHGVLHFRLSPPQFFPMQCAGSCV